MTDAYLNHMIRRLKAQAQIPLPTMYEDLLPGMPPDLKAFVAALGQCVAPIHFGQWSLALELPENLRSALPGGKSGIRSRRVLVVGIGDYEALVAGWEPWHPNADRGAPAKLYAVDTESGKLRKLGVFGGWFATETMLAGDPELDREGSLTAFRTSMPKTSVERPSLKIKKASPAQWTTTTSHIPTLQQEQLVTKTHARWLYHDALDRLVSITKKGVRYIATTGKVKSLNLKGSGPLNMKGTFSLDGRRVVIPAGNVLFVADLFENTMSEVLAPQDMYIIDVAPLGGASWLISTPDQLFMCDMVGERLVVTAPFTHVGLQPYPYLLTVPGLPLAFVSCSSETLVLAKREMEVVVSTVVPHRTTELKLTADGTLLAGYLTEASHVIGWEKLRTIPS